MAKYAHWQCPPSYAKLRRRKRRWFHFFIPIDIMSGSRLTEEFLQFVRRRRRRPQQEVQEMQLGDQTAAVGLIIIRQTARHRGRFSTGLYDLWIEVVKKGGYNHCDITQFILSLFATTEKLLPLFLYHSLYPRPRKMKLRVSTS